MVLFTKKNTLNSGKVRERAVAGLDKSLLFQGFFTKEHESPGVGVYRNLPVEIGQTAGGDKQTKSGHVFNAQNCKWTAKSTRNNPETEVCRFIKQWNQWNWQSCAFPSLNFRVLLCLRVVSYTDIFSWISLMWGVYFSYCCGAERWLTACTVTVQT